LHEALYNKETGVLREREPALRSAFPTYLSRMKGNMKDCYDELDLGRTMTDDELGQLSERDDFLKIICEKYHSLKKPKKEASMTPKTKREGGGGGSASKKFRPVEASDEQKRVGILVAEIAGIDIQLDKARGKEQGNLKNQRAEKEREILALSKKMFTK